MGLLFNEDINTLFVNGTEVSAAYIGSIKVWPVGLPVGTVFNFEYTGTVQEVELPAGKYKLQCWGAQGGSVTGAYAITGSKGGYSEGVLTLTKKTKLYVFVGGQGTNYTSAASQTSTSVVNGGWNGGGAGVRTSRYSSGDTDGRSFPRGGGGATDISTVTSALRYSSGRTTRDSASLLARCIVAGGGAGGSSRVTQTTTTSSSTSKVQTVTVTTISVTHQWGPYRTYNYNNPVVGAKYSIQNNTGKHYGLEMYDASGAFCGGAQDSSVTIPSGCTTLRVVLWGDGSTVGESVSADLMITQTTSSTSTSTGYSNKSQQGGGTSGKGQYPGTQTSAGSGGGFGYGANQEFTNYRYCAGGGGGGWYGGGTNKSDSSTSYVNYSGGGSGFVNTAANAASRPSGYTGLQLDSGTTTAGNTSHPSTSGGTETGHSGNGYVRITVL